MEINKDPQEIKEDVDGVFTTTDKALNIDEFVHKINETKNRNAHLYDRLDVELVAKSGAAVLMVKGARKENAEEIKARLEKEESKNKSVEEHERKEYLRLRKKFEKRKEE